MNTVIDAVKQEMRAQVWDLLESERAVQHGVHGYIPFPRVDPAHR